MAGERSNLARGAARCGIFTGRWVARVHGLGWTRAQLAFVLKLSVVGVRKMEHGGTAPVKSLDARKGLLGLAQPGVEIVAYIEREAAALG